MKILLPITILLLALTSCKKEEPQPDMPVNLSFKIDHQWNGDSLEFQSKGYVSPGGDSLVFKRIAYLLSEFKLRKEDGTWVTIPNAYAYINPREGRTEFQFSEVPGGKYTAVSYMIGLMPDVNHGNPNQYPSGHALDPLTNNLHWTWSQGYVFIALEGYYYTTGAQKLFSLHIAFTENQVPYTMEGNFDLTQSRKLTFNFDAREIFQNPEMYIFSEDGTVTHSGNDNGLALKVSTNLRTAMTFVKAE